MAELPVIKEGDRQTLTLTATKKGNYTGRDNYFTAKKNIYSEERVIDKKLDDGDAVYYSQQDITTFTVQLESDEVANIIETKLYCDISSYSKSDTKDIITPWQEVLRVDISVRRPGDTGSQSSLHYKGEKTKAELDAMSPAKLQQGDWAVCIDLRTILFWNVTTEKWE